MAEVLLMRPVAALSRGLRRTQVVGRRIVPVESEEVQLRRGITIGGMGFVLEGNPMMEVLDSPKIFAIPNTPLTCRGIVNLRGGLIPVFDIRKRIGGEGGAFRWVLVIERGERAAGVVIDSLPLQLKLSESNRCAISDEMVAAIREAVVSSYEVEGNIFHALDHQQLLYLLKGH